MFYEATVKITKIDEKGNDKEVKESFILQDIEFFAEAEAKLIDMYNNECDVVSIKRSNIMEIVNNPFEESKIFKSKLISTFVDDKGKEKETSYYVLLFAKSAEQAISIMKDYVRQGLNDLEIKAIIETKFLEILK